MKSIIQGKRYDTEKAILIGGFSNLNKGASSHSDFHYWEAHLYVTPRSGAYFLAGKGHAMSRFGSHGGRGEKIIPMTKEEALEWAERYLDPKTVEEYFGDMVEDA